MRHPRSALLLLGYAACCGLLLSGTGPVWLPIGCAAWLFLKFAILDRLRWSVPDAVGALLQVCLAVAFLWIAIVRPASLDPVAGLLTLCALLFVVRNHLKPTRFNEFSLIILTLVIAIGSAAVSTGVMPLLITAVYLITASLALPALVVRPSRRDERGGTRILVTRAPARFRVSALLVSTTLALVGLGMGTMLYLVVPRMSLRSGVPGVDETELDEDVLARRRGRSGAAGRPGARQLRTGFPREIKLGDVGRIKQDGRIAFELSVRLYGRPYDPTGTQRNALLLRARAWETYDPSRSVWIKPAGPFRRLPDTGLLEAGDAPFDFDISLRADEGKTLFLPQSARQVRSPSRRLYRNEAGVVLSKEPLRQYGVEAGIPVTHAVDIRRLRWAPADARLFAVPEPIRSQLRPFLPSGGHASVAQAVDALRQFFTQNDFLYTLKLPDTLEPGVDPVVAFLNRREGHCELYASASCFLLRMMGVPARIVGGVRCSERIGKGMYRARFSASHTWVEIPCRGQGFVAFDFTPPDSRAIDGNQAAPEAESAPADESDEDLGELTVSEVLDWQHPFRYGRLEQERLIGWAATSVELGPALWVLGALFLLVLGRGFWQAWQERERDPHRLSAPAGMPVRTLAFYARWLRRCAGQGYRRGHAQTPREFLATLPAELSRDGRKVTAEFERMRYGGKIQ